MSIKLTQAEDVFFNTPDGLDIKVTASFLAKKKTAHENGLVDYEFVDGSRISIAPSGLAVLWAE